MLFATAFESLVVPIIGASLLGMVAAGLAVGALQVIGTALLTLTGHERVADPGFGRDDEPPAGPAVADDREGLAGRAEVVGSGRGGEDGREALSRMGLTLVDGGPRDPRDDLAKLGLLIPAIGPIGRVEGPGTS